MSDLQPTFELLLGKGLYTLPEAAILLGARRRNVNRWMKGYNYSRAGVSCRSDALWVTDIPRIEDQVELSFRDLIELRFVLAFTKAGLGLKAIRNCLHYARECIQSDRPFSTGQFRTDGQTIFLESLRTSGDTRLLDLKKRQYAFKAVVEQTFRDLDLEGDAVVRWHPFRGKQTIVIDPTRSFGQPITAVSGVPTVALADAVAAEGSVDRVAQLFEVTPDEVRDAVRYETELQAA